MPNNKNNKNTKNTKNKNQKKRRLTMSNSNYNNKRRVDRKYSRSKMSVRPTVVFKHKTSIYRTLTHYIVLDRKVYKCKLLYRIVTFKDPDDKAKNIPIPICVFTENTVINHDNKNHMLVDFMLDQYDTYMVEYERRVTTNVHADFQCAYLYPLDKHSPIHLCLYLFDRHVFKREKNVIFYKCATEYIINSYLDELPDWYTIINNVITKTNLNASDTYYRIYGEFATEIKYEQ